MVLILSVFEPEIEPVNRRMVPFDRGMVFGRNLIRGIIGRNEAVSASGIVGKVEAAFITQKLLDQFAPNCVILVGGAGAVDPSLSIGTVLIGNAFQEYDRVMPLPEAKQVFPASPQHLLFLEEYPKLRVGKIISGDELVQSESRRDQLWEKYQAIGLDMDSAAVAKVCAMNQTHFLSLKVVLDLCNDKTCDDDEKAFNEYAGLPASIVSEFLCRRIMVSEPFAH